jgi:hypothetical protein
LFSSATRTFHTTANVTSHQCDSGYKCPKTFFGTSSLFPYMVLFTSIKKTNEVFKEFPKTKDAITLKQHQQFFLECVVLIIIDDIKAKVISITCIGFIQ